MVGQNEQLYCHELVQTLRFRQLTDRERASWAGQEAIRRHNQSVRENRIAKIIFWGSLALLLYFSTWVVWLEENYGGVGWLVWFISSALTAIFVRGTWAAQSSFMKIANGWAALMLAVWVLGGVVAVVGQMPSTSSDCDVNRSGWTCR
ncbi:MAG: hypothetical protein R3D27_03530 [Hyphomicrobiaceae bacterium]